MAIHPDVVDILILGFYGGEQRGVFSPTDILFPAAW